MRLDLNLGQNLKFKTCLYNSQIYTIGLLNDLDTVILALTRYFFNIFWISSGAYFGFTILSVALLPENSPVSLAVALWNTFLKATFRGSTTVLVEVSKNFFLYSLVRFLENYKTHVYIYSYP